MKRLLTILFLTVAVNVVAQQHFKENNLYELTGAVGKHQGSVAMSWSHLAGIGKGKKLLRIGYGIRFTSYFGKDRSFITAPARLTSRQTGPQVLFSKTYNESLDTVTFSAAQINSLNATLNVEYSIHPAFQIGFNIDAIGVSFGKRQTGKLQSTLRPGTLSEEQTAKPTGFNLLLVSDNDLGSLNSEFILRYWFAEKLAIKAGFCFLFAEYQTDNKLIFNNDRFRNKASLALLGISYNPFK
jgi:hypothetical protein